MLSLYTPQREGVIRDLFLAPPAVVKNGVVEVWVAAALRFERSNRESY